MFMPRLFTRIITNFSWQICVTKTTSWYGRKRNVAYPVWKLKATNHYINIFFRGSRYLDRFFDIVGKFRVLNTHVTNFVQTRPACYPIAIEDIITIFSLNSWIEEFQSVIDGWVKRSSSEISFGIPDLKRWIKYLCIVQIYKVLYVRTECSVWKE